MKNQLELQFRGYPADVAARLPADWQFLVPLLNDDPGPEEDHTCWLVAEVDGARMPEILAWGREHEGGLSRIRAAKITDRYEIGDLDGLDVVEIFLPLEIERLKINNAKKALDLKYACANCNRITAAQTADLDVKAKPPLDFQMSENRQWLASPRVQPILADAGIAFRPLASGNYRQVLVTETCDVRLDLAPVTTWGECPGCGEPSRLRTDLVEGQPAGFGSPDMRVEREKPLSVSASCRPKSIAQSPVPLFRSTIAAAQPGRVGTPFDYRYIHQYYDTRPLYFADAGLVRRLLEIGATGLAFRPVKVVEPS